ncbi:cyclin-dependent kinase 2-interacting protein [Lampris incognitus]|uniref:cyclin-dependent kinase 2-interacting protein n=1 Tax=Lampris incognitus TaxID=2546036 RepID=UPI0024B5ED46|nr:cyclin-dependent kinase 2-interacting protein [Lampris incognitus]
MEGSRKMSAVTGSARKIKDNAADWHNLIMRWEQLNDEGSGVANKIVNLRLKDSQEQEVVVGEHNSCLSRGRSPAQCRQLQEECTKLQYVVDKMTGIVAKMEQLLTSQRGIIDLELFQFGAEGRQVPLFHSWPTAHFVEVSRFLFDAYSQELSVKKTILHELAHTETSDLSMTFLSCWLYQPYIPPQLRLTLEALLLETGHRPL